MLTEDELSILREEMDQFFPAECRLFRYDPEGRSVDKETLEEVWGTEEVVYEGHCFFQATTRSYEDAFTQGEARQVARTYIFRLPWGVEDVRVGDLIRVTDGPDPYSIDKEFTVIDPQTSSQQADRRIIAELNLGH